MAPRDRAAGRKVWIEAQWPKAVAPIRLLARTGCRRSEVLNLRRRDIGEDALNLADSKTGRTVPLGKATQAHTEALPSPSHLEDFLFPSHAHEKAVMSGEKVPLVDRLLGHRRHRNRAGYVHLVDAHLVKASDKIGNIIAKAMTATSF